MNTLYPETVWNYFNEILSIPRLSKKEEKIIDHLEAFSSKHDLDFKKDSLGNCLIRKPATNGYEGRQAVILQSHLDMVGEKLNTIDHDFDKDPIQAVFKDDWMMAEGTTLGADDGIGIPKEKQDKLFRIDENYSQKGTNDESGTGLGLILCKEFVEKNGGQINLESEEGQGSKFIFTLQRQPGN